LFHGFDTLGSPLEGRRVPWLRRETCPLASHKRTLIQLLTVNNKLEQIAPVLLCKLEKTFPAGFFNPMEHIILHLPHEAWFGGPCRTVSAIQLRGFARFFEEHVKIKIKLKIALQGHKFCRRCQTSQLNTMRSTFSIQYWRKWIEP
jgi:hypothetical protein